MLEDYLLNYGMGGIFILYLIYDRKVVMKELTDTIKTNTAVTQSLKDSIQEGMMQSREEQKKKK
jgi:hypothetical protein